MACDSCWTYGDTQVGVGIKIRKLSSGALLGQAGDNDCRAIDALLDKVRKPEQLPSREELAATHVAFMGLLALPRGGIWVISSAKVDESGWPTDDDEDVGVWMATTMGGYAAVGSGADHALAAMDAGATARQAVEIAIRRNINCRGPVHVRRLVEIPAIKPKKKRRA